jgi:hypothetical protein
MDAHNVLRLAEEAFLDSHKLKWNIIRKVDESRKNIRMKLEGALERTN